MSVHPLAGKPPPSELLVDVDRLLDAYASRRPDPGQASERVAFGTSGHRGSALRGSFNEAHVLGITQAICDYRHGKGIDGPLFLGKDTHGLSGPAFATALEVLAGNGVHVRIDQAGGATPTPVVSHAILVHNHGRSTGCADGILLTPSHNPPEDGGIKYNPPHGGPAEGAVTGWIEKRANTLLEGGLRAVRRHAGAATAPTTARVDFVSAYVAALADVVDLDAVHAAGIRIGVDPLGGAGLAYWEPIASCYGLDLELVNPSLDPTFRCVAVDWDGKIRKDCSSPYAMAGLIALRERFDIAFGNDADADRHGIVTLAGLMNPNHYRAVVVDYLFRCRSGWNPGAAVGKTVVTSSLVDRVAQRLGRALVEVPVGFKWFVPGLLAGSCGFGGEESAGASFLRRDGSVWTTDKDGLVLGLLAAEIMAQSGRDPAELYKALVADLGEPVYERRDTPATPAQKARLARLAAADLDMSVLAGDPVRAVLTRAPGNDEPIGGIKVVTEGGWIAVRPSGTEDVAKLYAESFKGREHLRRLQDEAQALLARAAG